MEIGDWIKKNTNKDDYIYILGAEMELVQIMAISQRLSSSKYFHSIFITTDIQREEILEDLKKKPPRYILKHKNFDKELITIYGDRFNSLIQNNYVVVKETHDVEIFKRN